MRNEWDAPNDNGWSRCRHDLTAGISRLHVYSAFWECNNHAAKPNIGISHGVGWDYPGPSFAVDVPFFQKKVETQLRVAPRLEDLVSVDTNTANWFQTVDYDTSRRVRVIPNYADFQSFWPRKGYDKDPKTVRIGYPRRITDYRGRKEVLEIVDAFLEEFPHTEFWWIGRGFESEEKEVRDKVAEWYGRAKATGTLPRMRFFKLDTADMPVIFRQLDVSIIPTQWSEGTSLSCIEAMASGNAVISSRVGGLSDLVIDGFNGYLIGPTAEELLGAMRRLMRSGRLADFKRNSVALSKAFSRRNWERKWEDTIKRALGRSSSRGDVVGPRALGAPPGTPEWVWRAHRREGSYLSFPEVAFFFRSIPDRGPHHMIKWAEAIPGSLPVVQAVLNLGFWVTIRIYDGGKGSAKPRDLVPFQIYNDNPKLSDLTGLEAARVFWSFDRLQTAVWEEPGFQSPGIAVVDAAIEAPLPAFATKAAATVSLQHLTRIEDALKAEDEEDGAMDAERSSSPFGQSLGEMLSSLSSSSSSRSSSSSSSSTSSSTSSSSSSLAAAETQSSSSSAAPPHSSASSLGGRGSAMAPDLMATGQAVTAECTRRSAPWCGAACEVACIAAGLPRTAEMDPLSGKKDIPVGRSQITVLIAIFLHGPLWKQRATLHALHGASSTPSAKVRILLVYASGSRIPHDAVTELIAESDARVQVREIRVSPHIVIAPEGHARSGSASGSGSGMGGCGEGALTKEGRLLERRESSTGAPTGEDRGASAATASRGGEGQSGTYSEQTESADRSVRGSGAAPSRGATAGLWSAGDDGDESEHNPDDDYGSPEDYDNDELHPLAADCQGATTGGGAGSSGGEAATAAEDTVPQPPIPVGLNGVEDGATEEILKDGEQLPSQKDVRDAMSKSEWSSTGGVASGMARDRIKEAEASVLWRRSVGGLWPEVRRVAAKTCEDLAACGGVLFVRPGSVIPRTLTALALRSGADYAGIACEPLASTEGRTGAVHGVGPGGKAKVGAARRAGRPGRGSPSMSSSVGSSSSSSLSSPSSPSTSFLDAVSGASVSGSRRGAASLDAVFAHPCAAFWSRRALHKLLTSKGTLLPRHAILTDIDMALRLPEAVAHQRLKQMAVDDAVASKIAHAEDVSIVHAAARAVLLACASRRAPEPGLHTSAKGSRSCASRMWFRVKTLPVHHVPELLNDDALTADLERGVLQLFPAEDENEAGTSRTSSSASSSSSTASPGAAAASSGGIVWVHAAEPTVTMPSEECPVLLSSPSSISGQRDVAGPPGPASEASSSVSERPRQSRSSAESSPQREQRASNPQQVVGEPVSSSCMLVKGTAFAIVSSPSGLSSNWVSTRVAIPFEAVVASRGVGEPALVVKVRVMFGEASKRKKALESRPVAVRKTHHNLIVGVVLARPGDATKTLRASLLSATEQVDALLVVLHGPSTREEGNMALFAAMRERVPLMVISAGKVWAADEAAVRRIAFQEAVLSGADWVLPLDATEALIFPSSSVRSLRELADQGTKDIWFVRRAAMRNLTHVAAAPGVGGRRFSPLSLEHAHPLLVRASPLFALDWLAGGDNAVDAWRGRSHSRVPSSALHTHPETLACREALLALHIGETEMATSPTGPLATKARAACAEWDMPRWGHASLVVGLFKEISTAEGTGSERSKDSLRAGQGRRPVGPGKRDMPLSWFTTPESRPPAKDPSTIAERDFVTRIAVLSVPLSPPSSSTSASASASTVSYGSKATSSSLSSSASVERRGVGATVLLPPLSLPNRDEAPDCSGPGLVVDRLAINRPRMQVLLVSRRSEMKHSSPMCSDTSVVCAPAALPSAAHAIALASESGLSSWVVLVSEMPRGLATGTNAALQEALSGSQRSFAVAVPCLRSGVPVLSGARGILGALSPPALSRIGILDDTLPLEDSIADLAFRAYLDSSLGLGSIGGLRIMPPFQPGAPTSSSSTAHARHRSGPTVPADVATFRRRYGFSSAAALDEWLSSLGSEVCGREDSI